MSVAQITREHVLQAIAEYDEKGATEFLKLYEFAAAQRYWILHNGRQYPSKAILSVAHRYTAAGSTALTNSRPGGKATVVPYLQKLGFEITSPGEVSSNIQAAKLDGELDHAPGTGKRVSRNILDRRGQPAFRRALLEAFQKKCAISGCCVVEILEAAHIDSFAESLSDHISNGLLLRADLHTLFDLDLIGIDPRTMTVVTSDELRESEYAHFSRKPVTMTLDHAQRLDASALMGHLQFVLGNVKRDRFKFLTTKFETVVP